MQAKILATDGATAYVLVEPANCQLAQIVQSRREDIEKSTGTAIKVEKLPSGVKADADSTSNVKDAKVTVSRGIYISSKNQQQKTSHLLLLN